MSWKQAITSSGALLPVIEDIIKRRHRPERNAGMSSVVLRLVHRNLQRGLCATVLLCSSTLLCLDVSAHHSGALFYTMGERITLTGTVESFNFRNPHAIVILQVTGADGTIERWTCETSAPSALRRRGWSQQSITAGETVTLGGVPARDGSRLMRITAVTKADGTEVGVSARMDD